jgi:S-DNA-T family DNA segregation ATPase FtsK/SpoIIIE
MPRPRSSRWADPAPLEINRPQLPWCTLLPGWVQLVLLPVAVVWFLGWVLFHIGHALFRYPLFLLALVCGLWLWFAAGRWSVIGIVAGVALTMAVWRWLHPASFERFGVPELRTEWRRLFVYAVYWREVMRLADLTKTIRGHERRPGLRLVRSDGWRDRVRVRMVRGQAPETWELHASGLAHAFNASSCRVRVLKPGRLELDFVHSNPLAAPLPVPALSGDAAAVDLRRVPIGRTETGKPWFLRLLGTHLLTVGVSGAGKGSVLWSLVWALAPLLKSGRVRLVGVDPKGGMELGQAPEVFHRLAYDNGEDAVRLLEDLAADVKRRAESYRGKARSWTPETGDPFTVLVIDELADLLAYQADKQLRERANRAVQTITSQGRAPGVCVVGLLQDPRKEVVAFRHLFSTKIAMRLDEPQQVDMVLGDGVRQRGAAAHEIPEATPGVAWVKDDGRREPVRARAFHVTDGHLDELVTFVTGRKVHRAEVLRFPDRDQRQDGGAVA